VSAYIDRTINAMQKMLKFVGGWSLLFGFFLLGCTAQSDEETIPNRIVYGLSLQVSGIDPHINQSSELGIVLRQVYDTLVYRHPETREFVPGLAESWATSEDGLRYRFNLRTDVIFHDGTPFDANAVRSNLERIMAPETNSQRARLLLGPLTGWEVIDTHTIELILSEPYGPLLDGLAQVYVGIASPAALEAVNALPDMEEYNTLLYQYHQVGTGPFEFVEYLPGDRIVIRRFDNYSWGPGFYENASDNAIDEIIFRFFEDEATRALALESGEADIMGELLPTDARALTNNPSIQLQPVAVPGQPLQFYMNTKLFPTDNLAVRQALLYSANRAVIVESIFQGLSPVAWGPLSADSLYYNPGVRGVYDFDPETARQLLNSVGYEDTDNDGILDLDGTPLEIRVIQPPWGLVPAVLQVLRDQWREVGINTIIEPVPGFTALVNEVQQGNYNLVSFDTFGLDPVLLNPRFLSEGVVNWTGYRDAALDAALIEGARSVNEDQRRLAYGQAQAIIMQQALILPIRDYVNLNAHSARVRNLTFDPYGWFPLLHDAILVDVSQ